MDDGELVRESGSARSAGAGARRLSATVASAVAVIVIVAAVVLVSRGGPHRTTSASNLSAPLTSAGATPTAVLPDLPPTSVPDLTSSLPYEVPTADAAIVVRVESRKSGNPVLVLSIPDYCPGASPVPRCLMAFDTATGTLTSAGTYTGSVGPCTHLPTEQPSLATPFFVDPAPTDGCPQLPPQPGLAPGSAGWLVGFLEGTYFETADGHRYGPAIEWPRHQTAPTPTSPPASLR